MLKNLSKLFFLISVLLYALPNHKAYGQGQDEEKFTSIGPIGISNKHIIPEKGKAIIFRIKNYTSRSINKIYGRVFLINKNETDPAKRFVLINNPHKGGNIVKGNPHRPGTISEWNFVLTQEPLNANQNIDYTLQVHPRSIFFVNVEPPQKQ